MCDGRMQEETFGPVAMHPRCLFMESSNEDDAVGGV